MHFCSCVMLTFSLKLSVKPCSLRETHPDIATQSKTTLTRLRYPHYDMNNTKCGLKCFKDKAKQVMYR